MRSVLGLAAAVLVGLTATGAEPKAGAKKAFVNTTKIVFDLGGGQTTTITEILVPDGWGGVLQTGLFLAPASCKGKDFTVTADYGENAPNGVWAAGTVAGMTIKYPLPNSMQAYAHTNGVIANGQYTFGTVPGNGGNHDTLNPDGTSSVEVELRQKDAVGVGYNVAATQVVTVGFAQ
jgi:hypothetical protein